MNPNSHIPYLQAQLAFDWHNRLVLDRQSSTRTDITFDVVVALVDTMRLHGIQSSDPVALTSFSSIIRPLSIMVYAAKGDMAIKVMVL